MKKTLLLSVLAFALVFVCRAQGDRVANLDNLVKQINPKLEVAKADIDKEVASEAHKNDMVSWYLKAYIYKEMMKSDVQKKKFPTVGIESLEAAKKCKSLDVRKDLWPKLINVLFDLGPLFYNDAIKTYNAAIGTKKKDDFIPALKLFDLFYETLETLENDEKIVTHMLEYSKVSLKSINQHAGYSAWQIGDKEKSKKYFKKLIFTDVDDAVAKEKGTALAYIYYTQMLIEENNITEALQVVSKGLSCWPDNGDMLNAAVAVAKKSNNNEELIKLFEKIIVLNPQDIKTMSILASKYKEEADKSFNNGYESAAVEWRKKAATTYQKVLDLNPKDNKFLFTVNYNLGLLYYNPGVKIYSNKADLEKEKYTELFNLCLPFLEKAHKLEPNDKNVVTILMNIYKVMHNTEKGVEMEQKLEKLK